MSKRRRGMSLEEKREVMLDLLVETKDVYDLKELEKIGGKRGVVTQTIKDVLQTLVDDNMIELEKIGAKNFYWAFPSKAYRRLLNAKAALEADIAGQQAASAAAEEEFARLRAERIEGEDRTAKLQRLEELRARKASLAAEVEREKKNDPEVHAALLRRVGEAKQAAERWTDNLWATRDHLVRLRGCSRREADKMLQIPEDLDYVE